MPELNRLMAEAQRRKLLSWPFGSSTVLAGLVAHLLRALETFRSLRVEFVSLSEAIDTTTPAGIMVFTVLGAVAELERSLIGERV
jgi:DNA invertase Pin-like site-specific DNA recombinase